MERVRNVWRERFRVMQAEWEYTGGEFCAEHTLSGKISDYYFNSNVISQNTRLLDELCSDYYVPLLEQRQLKIDWVVSYPPYGLPFAWSLARALGASAGYIQSLESPSLVFNIPPEASVLLVADDIFSGSSIRITREAALGAGCRVLPVLPVFGNFSGQLHIDGLEVISILEREVTLWDRRSCPLIAKGIRPLLARENWAQFEQ